MLVVLRRHAYQVGWLSSEHPGIPTLVVGNVVAGGAGKTPTVIALVQHLQARGWRPGIISRGYGRRRNDCLGVQPDSAPEDVGDEPLLMRRATQAPVFVARRRIDAARMLRQLYPETDIIVCDDGLQHLALQRDLEVCVFDERGVGNGFLLPAGPLREPWPRSVDMVLNTVAKQAASSVFVHHPSGFIAQRSLADHAIRMDGQRTTLGALRQQPLLAIAGIARPEVFFRMLRACGLTLSQTQSLPDHHDFALWQRPSKAHLTLVCTEKDAAKLWVHHPEAWAVPLELTPEPSFFAALDQRLGTPLSSRDGHQTS